MKFDHPRTPPSPRGRRKSRAVLLPVWAFMAGYRVNQIIVTTSSVLPWRNMLIASLFVADDVFTLTRNMNFDIGAQIVQLQIQQRTASR